VRRALDQSGVEVTLPDHLGWVTVTQPDGQTLHVSPRIMAEALALAAPAPSTP
jgi:hypothetical protein